MSGGIGGAKLALGLYQTLGPHELTVICNPGDDFEHLGLTICPDFDTVLYTLSGLSNTELGWGRAGETWSFMETLGALGGETWFNLGDGDLALHVERSRRFAAGETATTVARAFTRAFGLTADLIPPCDAPLRTVVDTVDLGPLAFQRYFVEHCCTPVVTGFRFEGAQTVRLTDAAASALDDPTLKAIIICPSNPFISIDPILHVPGMRAAMRSSRAPVIAVSPLIAGDAVKGPTAKMMGELDIPRTNASLARHYGDVVDGWIVDEADVQDLAMLGTSGSAVPTLMTDVASKHALARTCLQLADLLAIR